MGKYSKDLDELILLLKGSEDGVKAYNLLVKNKGKLLFIDKLGHLNLILSCVSVVIYWFSLRNEGILSNLLSILGIVLWVVALGIFLYLLRVDLSFIKYINSVLKDLGTIVSYSVEERGGLLYYARGDDMVLVSPDKVFNNLYREKTYKRISEAVGKVYMEVVVVKDN